MRVKDGVMNSEAGTSGINWNCRRKPLSHLGGHPRKLSVYIYSVGRGDAPGKGCVCVYISIYIPICIYMCVCIYICVCVCVCV